MKKVLFILAGGGLLLALLLLSPPAGTGQPGLASDIQAPGTEDPRAGIQTDPWRPVRSITSRRMSDGPTPAHDSGFSNRYAQPKMAGYRPQAAGPQGGSRFAGTISATVPKPAVRSVRHAAEAAPAAVPASTQAMREPLPGDPGQGGRPSLPPARLPSATMPAVLVELSGHDLAVPPGAVNPERLADDFIAALGPEPADPAGPGYHARWSAAVAASDILFKSLYGAAAWRAHHIRAHHLASGTDISTPTTPTTP
jgi:hypothetical protein